MKLAHWGLLLAGGACYALANVGWGLWPLAFIGLVPLWQAIADGKSRSRLSIFLLGVCYGGIAYSAGFGWLFALAGHFIDSVTGASLLWLAYGGWFALGFGVYALGSQWLLSRGCPDWASLTIPLLLLEAVQPALFPTYLGAGLLHQAYLSQLASLGGPLLLSALALICNWQLYSAINNLSRRRCLLALGRVGLVLLMALSYGQLRLGGEDAGASEDLLHVGVVQNNVVRPGQEERHTLSNLLASGVYSINHVTGDITHAAHQTAARYDRSVSEFAATGLTPEWVGSFGAPFVAEAGIKLGMELREHQELAINETHLVIGEIVHALLPPECLRDDGAVDLQVAGTVALSGLDTYSRPEPIARMAYAKPDLPPTELKL